MTKMSVIFFDSWGNPWEVVPADHPDAEAFGPLGAARRAVGVPCLRDTPKNELEETPEGWVFLRPADRALEHRVAELE